MSIWDTLAKDAETGTGGGEIPDIPNDLYNATITAVSEPEDKPDPFNEGKTKTQFYITWRLESDDFEEEMTRRQYVTLPPGYFTSGMVHEKSVLHEVMTALGYDMNGRYRVDPREWVGKQARVMIENKENKRGEVYPTITGVQPPRKKKAAAPVEKPQPVGAGARRSSYDDEDDE